jgi:hypothetical protein
MTNSSKMTSMMIRIKMQYVDLVSARFCKVGNATALSATIANRKGTGLTFVRSDERFQPFVCCCELRVRSVDPERKIIQHSDMWPQFDQLPLGIERGYRSTYSFCSKTSLPIRPACPARVAMVPDMTPIVLSCCRIIILQRTRQGQLSDCTHCLKSDE